MRWRPGAAPGAARRRRRCQQASRGVVHASRPAASGGGAWSSAPFHALWDAESRRIDDLDGLEDEAEDLVEQLLETRRGRTGADVEARIAFVGRTFKARGAAAL